MCQVEQSDLRLHEKTALLNKSMISATTVLFVALLSITLEVVENGRHGETGEAACKGRSVAANEISHQQKQCKCCASTNSVHLQCSKCNISSYCDKTCHQKHWPEHKHICEALQTTNSLLWNEPSE